MVNSYVPLSDRAKAIILGTILGDGSLKVSKKYCNANLQFRHSETQKEYFFWKVSELSEIQGDNGVSLQKADGYSKNRKYRFYSKRLPSLTEMYELTHKRNKLCIRRKWLNQLTPLSLAVWWFDDGSLISNTRKGVFCTDGFDKKSVETLSQYMRTVWRVRTIVAPVKRERDGRREQYWRLWIRSSEELKKFFRIIIPHIPVKSMLRKVLLVYKDSQLQQRWISEIENLSQFSRSEIERALAEKKKKWKKFR